MQTPSKRLTLKRIKIDNQITNRLKTKLKARIQFTNLNIKSREGSRRKSKVFTFPKFTFNKTMITMLTKTFLVNSIVKKMKEKPWIYLAKLGKIRNTRFCLPLIKNGRRVQSTTSLEAIFLAIFLLFTGHIITV